MFRFPFLDDSDSLLHMTLPMVSKITPYQYSAIGMGQLIATLEITGITYEVQDK